VTVRSRWARRSATWVRDIGNSLVAGALFAPGRRAVDDRPGGDPQRIGPAQAVAVIYSGTVLRRAPGRPRRIGLGSHVRTARLSVSAQSTIARATPNVDPTPVNQIIESHLGIGACL